MGIRKQVGLCVFLLSAIFTFQISACKKELSCERCRCGNAVLLANAGADQSLLTTSSTILTADTLNAQASNIREYRWYMIEGPAHPQFSDSLSYQTSLEFSFNGIYTIGLTITDACNFSSSDTVNISFFSGSGPQPPVANAGEDFTDTLPLPSIALSGKASTDPDNDIVSYHWSIISAPAGMLISQADLVETTINTPAAGEYEIELLVTDATGLKSKDTILITIVSTTQEPPRCAGDQRPEIKAKTLKIGEISSARSDISVAVYEDLVFFAGGGEPFPSKKVDIWNTRNNTFYQASLSLARFGMATAVSKQKIFFAGGYCENDLITSRVDIYDALSRTWSTAELSQPRAMAKAAVAGNKVLFIGGYYSNQPITVVDIFDIPTNTWSKHQLPNTAQHRTATVIGNKLYLAGGYFENGDVTKELIIFDAGTGEWSSGTDLTYPKGVHAGIAYQNKNYWAGGFEAWGKPTCNVEIRDMLSGQSTFGSLSFPVAFVDAFEVNNKMVFIHNGVDYSFFFDSYDPQQKKWTRILYDLPDILEVTIIPFVVNRRLHFLVASADNNGRFTTIYSVDY